MKKFLYLLHGFYNQIKRDKDIQKNIKYQKNRLEAEIIRNVHSIEKGLSIQNPRPGFGLKKIREMFTLVEKYLKCFGDEEIIYFVIDAVKEYLKKQQSMNFENEDILFIKQKLLEIQSIVGEHEGVYGGTLIYKKSDVNFKIDDIENFFKTRHSIRDFSTAPIDEENLIKAIKLAQSSPSACNRQAVRVYSIKPNSYMNIIGNLDGIGGFAESVERFLLITGVQSAYRAGEKNQFVVSAAMFASYLSLSLHAYGIGACVIQRSLIENKLFKKFKEVYNISEDEQVVVMLGVGKIKEETTVPVSRRFDVCKIYRDLEKNNKH